MNLKRKMVATAAALSTCAMLVAGFAPAAQAATRLTTPAPVVLQDEVTGIIQVSTAARPQGTVGYHLQQAQANGSWKTMVTCPQTCSYPLSSNRAYTWRLIAYGNSGASSAPSDLFATLPRLDNNAGDQVDLYLNRYNLYAMTLGALKYNAGLAANCMIDHGVQSGLTTLEKKSLQAAEAEGFGNPYVDVGAAALQFEKLIRSNFGSSCDNITAYDKLLAQKGAAVFATGHSQEIRVSSQVLTSYLPSCSIFFGDGNSTAKQNTVLSFASSCREFARKLWVSA